MAKKKPEDDGNKSSGNGPQPEPAATGSGGPTSAGEKPGTGPQLGVLAQYVKDLSFESPGAPQTLQGPGDNPQLKIGVNVSGSQRGEDIHEVIVHVEANAHSDVGVIYNVELDYAGLFRIKNVPENLMQPVMFVDCPALLFPFVRRVISDVVRDGGFPPLMLDPIDFRRLFAQNMAKSQSQATN
jgi:preprotein translocase subunit SecB